MLANTESAEHQSDTPILFRRVARAIRLMAAMQLAPADYRQSLRSPTTRNVLVIFYVSCNAVHTPHLLLASPPLAPVAALCPRGRALSLSLSLSPSL